MEDVKKLFKRMAITAIAFLIYGLVIRNEYVVIGLVSGCVISILSLYMLSLDVKSIAYTKDQRIARKIAVIGALKRYFIYLAYLTAILYFLNFKYFISAAIGLFNARFNIYIIAIENKIKKIRK